MKQSSGSPVGTQPTAVVAYNPPAYPQQQLPAGAVVMSTSAPMPSLPPPTVPALQPTPYYVPATAISGVQIQPAPPQQRQQQLRSGNAECEYCRHAVTCGLAHIVIGSLSLLAGFLQIILAVAILASCNFNSAGVGIWSGIFPCVAGALSVSAGVKRNTCLNVASLVLNILSVWPCLSAAAVGPAINSKLARYIYYSDRASIVPVSCLISEYRMRTGIAVLAGFCAVFTLIDAIIICTECCRCCACCNSAQSVNPPRPAAAATTANVPLIPSAGAAPVTAQGYPQYYVQQPQPQQPVYAMAYSPQTIIEAQQQPVMSAPPAYEKS